MNGREERGGGSLGVGENDQGQQNDQGWLFACCGRVAFVLHW